MLYITPQEQIDEYFESTDLNQSTLKKIEEDFESVHQEGDYNKPWFITGSAVDTILTGEEGSFEKLYHVSASEKLPSPAVMAILDCVYEKLIEDYNEYVAVTVSGLEVKGAWNQVLDQEVVVVQEDNLLPQPQISSFRDFVGRLGEVSADGKTCTSQHATYLLDAASSWNPNYGPQAKLNNLIPPGMQYFNDLVSAYPKKIISSEHKEKIDEIVASLRSHIRTGKYFDREMLASDPHIEVYYQFPIYFEVEGIKCKALLDIVIVERDEEGIIKKITPIDLKTMSGNTYDFIDSLKKRRYDIQAAWYHEACVQRFKLESLATAIMQPFMFIVESSDKPGKPLVYEMTPELLRIGQVGMPAIQLAETNLFSDVDNNNITTKIKKEINGYMQLIDLYNFHQQNGWDEEKEIKEAKGMPLLLGWDGIIKRD